MKKNYFLLFLAVVLSVSTVFGQGVWKATGSEAKVLKSTAINTGIANLVLMHSDADATNAVQGKSDSGASSSTLNGVTYSNEAYIQGSTNAMYYALKPAIGGTLDIALKMGSAKALYVLELNTETSPDNLTFNTATVNTIANFTTPTVYDTYNNSSSTWNGTVLQSSGSNQYLVISFPVTANKVYAVGCTGSKLMVRGIRLAAPTALKDVFFSKGITISKSEIQNANNVELEVYNITGKKVISSKENISLSNFSKGVYIVRIAGTGETQKFTI